MPRKVIQIAMSEASGRTMMALCDDGTMWSRNSTLDLFVAESPEQWKQVPVIPEEG